MGGGGMGRGWGGGGRRVNVYFTDQDLVVVINLLLEGLGQRGIPFSLVVGYPPQKAVQPV